MQPSLSAPLSQQRCADYNSIIIGTIQAYIASFTRGLYRAWNQRHPAYDIRVYLYTISGIFLLLFFILSIFRPFDISDTRDALVYSSGAFLTMLLSTAWILAFPRFFTQEKWTLGREFFMILYQMSSVAFTVWIMSRIHQEQPFALLSYFRTWLIVVLSGTLPYVVITLVRHIYLLKKNLRSAAALNAERYTPSTTAGNPLLMVIPLLETPVLADEFLFAESRGNYLDIYVLKNQVVEQYTVRSTLKDLEGHNSHIPFLFRCHRAFLVYLPRILHIQR